MRARAVCAHVYIQMYACNTHTWLDVSECILFQAGCSCDYEVARKGSPLEVEVPPTCGCAASLRVSAAIVQVWSVLGVA